MPMEHHAQEMVQEVLELLGNAIPHSGCSQTLYIPSPAFHHPPSKDSFSFPGEFGICLLAPATQHCVPCWPAGRWFGHLIPHEILLLDEHTPREFYFPSCRLQSEAPSATIPSPT